MLSVRNLSLQFFVGFADGYTMQTILVYCFWLWLLASLAVLVWRRVNRSPDPSDASGPSVASLSTASPPVEDLLAAAAPPTPVPPDSAAPPLSPPNAGSDARPVSPVPAVSPVAQIARVSPAIPGGQDTPVGPADDLNPEMMQPAVAAALREQRLARGEPAESSTEVTPSTGGLFDAAPVATITAPLVETLAGISMPMGLAPLSTVGRFDAPDCERERLTMITDTGTAAGVAGALATELQRLGHTVTPLDASSALARRGNHGVEVRIYAKPETELGEDGRMFPTVAPDNIVVDFLAC